MDIVNGDSIKGVVKSDVTPDQIIKTDGYKAYQVIKGTGHKHQMRIVKGKPAHTF